MHDQDALSDGKDENKELLAIIADYIQRYGLTEKAREFFAKMASEKMGD